MANTHFHEFLSKFVRGAKQFLIVGSLAMLVSCSSNTDGADGTLDGSITQNAAVVAGTQSVQVESERVDLMASLAVLYPNGQLPLEKTAAATNDLAQNPAALSATAESAGLIKSQSASTTIQPQATSADFLPVTRIQNTTLYGAYFFSIYPTEVTSALAGNRNWRLEGPAFWASLATGTDLFPVHRFQNKQNGSYLYTIYDFERANIAANFSATFAYEGVAWYARQTPGTGWSPLYRFRNKTNGTYLFSAYESEKDAIVANYPDIFELEGIAYYVRQDAPVDAPAYTVTSITPSITSSGIPTEYTVTGTNLPLTATLTMQDATCLTPVANLINTVYPPVSIGFTIVCSTTNTTGTKVFNVKTSDTGATIDATRSANVIAIPAVSVSNLTDTGTTNMQCHGAGSNAFIACNDPAALALSTQQDGMVGRDITTPNGTDGVLGFSYSKIGANPVTDCVKDNITGLIWEGEPLTVPSTTIGYALTNARAGTLMQTQLASHIAAINASNLCGFNNWRLPTRRELESLAYFGEPTSGGANADPTWIPNTGGVYWSSTPNAGYPSQFWTVGRNTFWGFAVTQSSGLYNRVRLVR
jgi:hypothetical protein